MSRRERDRRDVGGNGSEQRIEEAAEAAVAGRRDEQGGGKLDRRGFFKAAGAAVVGAGLLSACESPSELRGNLSTPRPPLPYDAAVARVPGPYEQVPQTPTEPPDPAVLEFFSMREARTVDALAATILPGSPEDPGAREAGALNYIDHLLAHEHGFAEPIYRLPPFAEPYSGDSPPAAPADGPQPVWVSADQLPRYGYQSSLTPREIYRRALPMIDEYSRNRFGASFADLPEGQQESVVEVMADSPEEIFGQEAENGFHGPALNEFFAVVRAHVIEGTFGDPLYGGNRDLVGWRMIDYPGAQRAYTPLEMRTEGTDKEPQSIAQLPHFNPGQPANEYVILPVSGSDIEEPR